MPNNWYFEAGPDKKMFLIHNAPILTDFNALLPLFNWHLEIESGKSAPKQKLGQHVFRRK